jgi:hypothetical protein
MTGSGNQPDDEAPAALDRDGQIQRVSERGQLAEELPEIVVGVLDKPLLDDRALIIDDAHPVMRRTPVPSAEHALLTSRSDIAAGAGPTVGSSLFGPLRGWSLAPITRPGNDEGDQLKQAIEWQDIEAVPRRSRRTGHQGPHLDTHPMRQRMASFLSALP